MTNGTEFDSGSPLRTWLFNPFHFVAGGKALGIGIIVVLVASFNGSVSNSHFDGVLDFHTGFAAPRWFFFAEGLIDWLSLAVLLWVAGLLISRSRMRAIDVFGTTALARFPTLGMAFVAVLPGFQRQTARFVAMDLTFLPVDMAVFSIGAIVMVAMLVWMVLLSYRAFAVSCNVRGAKAVVTFVVATILAEIVSKTVVGLLARQVLN